MLLVKENRLIRDVEYKRDPMYYRTKVDKLRTRLSAIPLVTRIDPTNRAVNAGRSGFHRSRNDYRLLESLISLLAQQPAA